MAEDSERMCARDEVRRASVVDSSEHELSNDAGASPRRRRRNRPAAVLSGGRVVEPPCAGCVGAEDERSLEAREVAQAIVRWYASQEHATKERVIEMQHWLRRLRGAERKAAHQEFSDRVKALVAKYGA